MVGIMSQGVRPGFMNSKPQKIINGVKTSDGCFKDIPGIILWLEEG
jgi:hypothetical protein